MQRSCFLSLFDEVAAAENLFFLRGGIDSMGNGAGGRQDAKNDTVDFSGFIPRMSESIDILS